MKPHLTAQERVVVRLATEPPGFVSERELSGPAQIKLARDLERRKILRHAGREPDGSMVYKVSSMGRQQFEKGGE